MPAPNWTEYAVTAAGHRKLAHNGALAHQGRLVTMDANAPATQSALTRGLITATLGGATAHDATSTGPATEGFQTYTVTAAGARKILHGTGNPPPTNPLPQGATLQLDPLEEPALTFAARGWIA